MTNATAEHCDVAYDISPDKRAQHIAHVTIRATGAQEFQLPVWNATYQVRDFAENVDFVTAFDAKNQPLRVTKLDKTTWRVTGQPARLEYDIYLDVPGPFGAQVNEEHAFLNLAQVLMYPVGQMDRGMCVGFTLISGPGKDPHAVSPMPGIEDCAGAACHWSFSARSYDRLVDSPIEIGAFRENSFQEGGATYHVVLDGPSDYDLAGLAKVDQRIAAAETAWMNDRPFEQYTFIYHLRRGPAGGGMEHAFGTAIDSSLGRGSDPTGLASVSAHEFFHLWNVKRIRPQSMEPIDYTKEQYTRSLWFSEGVTSTVGDYIMLIAGFYDEQEYLRRLSGQIQTLEGRPAHLTQSAEESSLDAWLEKYPYYRDPNRSISYYNKGEILGVLLDLQMREASHGAKSLRDLFHYLNDNYAKQGRFFDDSAGIRDAAEKLTGADFSQFFARYVAGLDPIPYDTFFNTAGLHLQRSKAAVADAGFETARNFGQPPAISAIAPGSPAEKAGLQAGDVILQVNGKGLAQPLQAALGQVKPGDTLELQVARGGEKKDFKFVLGSREEEHFELLDVGNPTPAQLARRRAWLHQEDQTAGSN